MTDQDVAEHPFHRKPTRLLLAVRTRELKTALFLSLSAEIDVRIVATAANSAELLTYARAFRPDAIVLEWELPGQSIGATLPMLSQSKHAPQIFIISRPSSQRHVHDFARPPNTHVIDSAAEELVSALALLRNSIQTEG